MSREVEPIPERFGAVTPSLTIDGAAEAIEFYREALGAELLSSADGPGGQVWHAEIDVGGSVVMLNDAFPEHGSVAPTSLGGTPVTMWVYVEDVDAAFRRAVDAGAEATMEPEDMFWGDRMAGVRDPFGHEWSLATHVEDVDPEEMQRRQREARKAWEEG